MASKLQTRSITLAVLATYATEQGIPDSAYTSEGKLSPPKAFSPVVAEKYVRKALRGASRRATKNPVKGQKTSGNSHTVQIQECDVEDCVQSAYLLWHESQANGRTPYDTYGACRRAMQDRRNASMKAERAKEATTEKDYYLASIARATGGQNTTRTIREMLQTASEYTDGAQLTSDEKEVIRLLAINYDKSEVAELLECSKANVSYILRQLRAKLDAFKPERKRGDTLPERQTQAPITIPTDAKPIMTYKPDSKVYSYQAIRFSDFFGMESAYVPMPVQLDNDTVTVHYTPADAMTDATGFSHTIPVRRIVWNEGTTEQEARQQYHVSINAEGYVSDGAGI